MSAYLGEHPYVFVTDPKEPHFFNTDFANRFTKSLELYESYYNPVLESHIAIGEASVFYLYSEDAVPNILQYNQDAKFVVVVRNPIEMAFSWHSQAIYSFGEDVRDFSRAWHLQSKRKQGAHIPRYCVEPKVLFYGELCKVGRQMERLFGRVPEERVLVLLFDELAKNPGSCYRRILDFLGVPDDGRLSFPVYNQNKVLRSPMAHQFVQFSGSVKRKLRIKKGLGLLREIHRINARVAPRPALSEELKEEMVEYFRGDIRVISSILGKDLSGWFNK